MELNLYQRVRGGKRVPLQKLFWVTVSPGADVPLILHSYPE